MNCPRCSDAGKPSGPEGHWHCDKKHTWVVREKEITAEARCPKCNTDRIHIIDKAGSHLTVYECDNLSCGEVKDPPHTWMVRRGLPRMSKLMLGITSSPLPEIKFRRLSDDKQWCPDCNDWIADGGIHHGSKNSEKKRLPCPHCGGWVGPGNVCENYPICTCENPNFYQSETCAIHGEQYKKDLEEARELHQSMTREVKEESFFCDCHRGTPYKRRKETGQKICLRCGRDMK